MARLTDEEKIAMGREAWLCLDCKKDTFISEEYYMLWHRIWRRINYKIDGMICLDCAEKRLGRPLHRDDFTKAPVNQNQAKICPELAVRMNAAPHI
jgi:hypothetical protein